MLAQLVQKPLQLTELIQRPFSVTDEVVFVVVCEDLGWLEVTVDSVDTETKVK
jgi:hypothetical protein